MSEYVDFHYMPLDGKITGKQVLQQTEDAINDLGNKVYNLDIDQSKIDDAVEKSEEAVNTANAALSAVTTGRSVWFNNVDEMVATDIEAGVTAETKGYYVANDGGNALYLIRQEKSGDVVDGGSLIALDNGNMAELVTDGTVNVKQFGAIGNGTDDDTTVFQNTSSYAQAKGFAPFVGVATYKITSNITGTFNSFGEVTITGGGSVDIINLQEVVSDVSDIRDEVVDETASAKAYSESAATSATNASNSASSASTTATQLMAYLETKETLTAPAVDPTLTISGAAADAKVTGDCFVAANANLGRLNSLNLLYFNSTYTRNNVTVTANPSSYNYSIVATSATTDGFVNLVQSSNNLSPFVADKDVYLKLKAPNHVSVNILETLNGSDWVSVCKFYNSDEEHAFKFSASAQGYIIRIMVDKNNAVNGTFELMIYDTPSNKGLQTEINDLDGKADSIDAKVDSIVISESTALVTIASFTENGYLDSTGAFVAATNDQWSTDYIPVEQMVLYKLDYSTMRAIWKYSSNKTPIEPIPQSTYNQNFRFIDGTTAYVRLNVKTDKTTATVNMYPLKDGLTIKKELNSDIQLPVVKEEHIGLRRPLIAFILDGDYDLNPTMHDVFVNHNVKCGFAPHYTTSFNDSATLQDYLDWQGNGFEILTHGVYDIGSNSALTDAEAIETIQNSYKYLKANGFDPKGYIGLAGNVKPKYIPEIAKLFDWSATTTNHYGTHEPCMFYGSDRPYYAWRYSMQVSTLQQQKDAVDRCLANNGLLLFYGHAKSDNTDNFTAENLDALLTYIETVGGEVVTPSYAVRNYFAIRYDDIYNIINA